MDHIFGDRFIAVGRISLGRQAIMGIFLGGILLMANIRTTPPKINMSPKKGPSQKDISSSNHQFSGDMLVFWGVHHEVDV